MPSDLELAMLDRIKEEAEEEAMRRLMIRKQNLLAELELLQTSAPVPADDDPAVSMRLEFDEEALVLAVDASHGRVIRGVILFAEGLFPNGESHAVLLDRPSPSVKVPLPVQRNAALDLHVNVMLGHADSTLWQVPSNAHLRHT